MVQAHRQQLYFVGMKPGVGRVLEGLGVLKHITPEQRYDFRLEALRHADQEGGSVPAGESSSEGRV
jgi:hypothetical protein